MILRGAVELQNAIKNKRTELHLVHGKHLDFLHPNVLSVSQQLDQLIVEAQRQVFK